MADFRQVLYERYVSNFKGEASHWSEAELSAFFSWSEHKYGPLLDDLPRDSAILELGCGPGYVLEFLKRRGFTRVAGIDISAQQVELAVQRGGDARVADVFRHLEGHRETFDVILALDFIEHFHKDELMELMPAVFQALKKGGRLILQTPNGEGLFPGQVMHGDLTHLTIFNPGSMSQLLKSVGFGEARFYETGPVPRGLKGRLRVFLWRRVKFFLNVLRKIETGKSQDIWTENMICRCERPRA